MTDPHNDKVPDASNSAVKGLNGCFGGLIGCGVLAVVLLVVGIFVDELSWLKNVVLYPLAFFVVLSVVLLVSSTLRSLFKK